MFPFVTVVECPESKMLEAIGPTLVCTAITCNEAFQRRLLDAVHVDRLNLGPRADHTAELASAARRQHRRVPVQGARVSVGATADSRSLRCRGPRLPVYEDPLHYRRRRGDVLRQLFSRQRAGDRVDGARSRRDAHSGLHADAHRRHECQPAGRAVRRHQRLPAAALGALPQAPAVSRSPLGLAARDRGLRRSRRVARCARSSAR